jgi:hypothetical protein
MTYPPEHFPRHLANQPRHGVLCIASHCGDFRGAKTMQVQEITDDDDVWGFYDAILDKLTIERGRLEASGINAPRIVKLREAEYARVLALRDAA